MEDGLFWMSADDGTLYTNDGKRVHFPPDPPLPHGPPETWLVYDAESDAWAPHPS